MQVTNNLFPKTNSKLQPQDPLPAVQLFIQI